MASHLPNSILIVFIIAIVVPISSAHTRKLHNWDFDFGSGSGSTDTERILRDICAETDNMDVCWNILKTNLQTFDSSDDKSITTNLINLAEEKSKEIREKLDQWFKDSDNEELKKKYHSCSKNYKDVDRKLKEAEKKLDSDDCRIISNKIDDAEKELEKCKMEFGVDSFDPPHVDDRNNELGLYLEIVRVAVDRLGNDNQDDGEEPYKH